MNLSDLLLTAPAPILESVAQHLRWRCSLNLWTALTSARGSADASSEHQLLLTELRQSAAATLLQRLARSHTSGHLLCGQSLRQRAIYLNYYLRIPTVEWLREAGRLPHPACNPHGVATARCLLRAALLWHPPIRRRAWDSQLTNGGCAWPEHQGDGHEHAYMAPWTWEQLTLCLQAAGDEDDAAPVSDTSTDDDGDDTHGDVSAEFDHGDDDCDGGDEYDEDDWSAEDDAYDENDDGGWRGWMPVDGEDDDGAEREGVFGARMERMLVYLLTELYDEDDW